MNTVPVAAPIDSDSAGRGGAIATQACVRIACPDINSSGTGFLHESGNIITAEHVVRDSTNIFVQLSDLSILPAQLIAVDRLLDLAILKPAAPLACPPLKLSSAQQFSVGAHVSTWGYPGGYSGAAPMLSAGYLAAMDAHRIGPEVVTRWVVNAAFNSGNSGGPLLLIETGEVIGVVSSKLAPLSAQSQGIINHLETTKSGFFLTITYPDGRTEDVSEAKLIAMVLNELRGQVQLVIGYAVLLEDLRRFLSANGATP